jgi:hypothetical protein
VPPAVPARGDGPSLGGQVTTPMRVSRVDSSESRSIAAQSVVTMRRAGEHGGNPTGNTPRGCSGHGTNVISIFFKPGPLFFKRDHFFPSDRYVLIRRSLHPVYSCSVLLLHVSGTAEHGRVSAQGGAVTGRHGSRRSHHFSSCTATQSGPAQALKNITIPDDDIKIICV